MNVSELRSRPDINFTPNILRWMRKLTNEELSKWEAEIIEEAKARILKEGRQVTDEEVRAHVRNEAHLTERDFTHLTLG
jgi:hypothetical protein